MEPFAIPIGFLIALAEIAIGLGVITGLAYRLAAVGGAVLSLLFWLTASWATRPYFYGPDLPYAFGWLALALAGDGGLLIPRAVREIGIAIEEELPWNLRTRGVSGIRGPSYAVEEASPARRVMLQAGVLGVASVAVASLGLPVRALRSASSDGLASGSGPGGSQSSGTTGGVATASPAATGATGATGPTASDPAASRFVPSGLTVASIANVDRVGAARIRIPASAPSPLPAGDPGIIVKLADGTYVAYDATCTHQGCRVGWDAQDGVLLCPCHGAAFDPRDHGAVLGGPTNIPLTELPIVVDHQAGTISLRA
jgi:thiosulfate dehydrogenase [quinone] large subunit